MATAVKLKRYEFGAGLSGGSPGSGDVSTSVAVDWLSYTFTRPEARVGLSGDQLMVVKDVAFTCAAYPTASSLSKSVSIRMYARVSAPSGTPYSDSQSQKVAPAHQASKAVVFKGVNLPVTSAHSSPDLRVWLAGNGAFYFQRLSTGPGHIVGHGGKAWRGSPTGYIEYAELPDSPTVVTPERDEADPATMTVTWLPPDDTGGVTLSGYWLQWAEDVDFSIGFHEVALTRTTYRAGNFKTDIPYYFRVAARNEVSDFFKEKGGPWSAVGTMTAYSPQQSPADDFGANALPLDYLPVGAAASAGPTFTGLPYPQRIQDVVRSPDTGEWFVTQARDPGASGQLGDTQIDDLAVTRCQSSGAVLDTMFLTDAGHGSTLALEYKNSQVWLWLPYATAGTTGAPNDLLRFPYTAGTFTRDTIPTPQQMPKFTNAEVEVSIDWIGDQIALKTYSAPFMTYELRKLSEYINGTDHVYSKFSVNLSGTSFQGWFTYGQSLFQWTGSANSPSDPATLVQFSWLDGAKVNTFDGSDLGKDSTGAYPGNWYEPEGVSLYNVDGSAPVAILGFTFNPFGSHYAQAFVLPLLTEAVAEKNAKDGSSSDPGGSDGSGGSGTQYTPVPDTSSTETQKGGLLLSRQPSNVEYSVFLMDRGGARRIGQLAGFDQLTWDRRRSDISQASVTLTAEHVKASQAALDRLATGRSELVVFRGDQRMWEGPVTSVQWARNSVKISAHDVLWWASRTVVHNSYSYARPNTGFSVEFIAGIMTSELARKEALDPPVNILPYLKTYVEDGDAKTSKVVSAGSSTLWQLLDEMSTSNGLNYTTVGRAVHIWDASRAALGRTRTVTDQDFQGEPYITEYGGDLATMYSVTDGLDGLATAGAIDLFYGEIELLAQAYGEASNQILDPTTGQVIGTTLTPADLLSQAERNLAGRNPVPKILNVPANSAFDVSRNGIGLDVLVPGVYIPVQATVSGRQMAQVQKLDTVKVTVTSGSESVEVSMIPAATVVDPTGGDAA